GTGEHDVNLRPAAEVFAQRAWARAKGAGAVEEIDDFLRDYGWSKKADEARRALNRQMAKLDSRHWKRATERGSTAAYKDYLELHPKGRHVKAAVVRSVNLFIAKKRYDKALAFVKESLDKGRLRATKARALDAQIRRTQVEDAWTTAHHLGTTAAYDAFLAAHPTSGHVRDARAAITRILVHAARFDDIVHRVDVQWCPAAKRRSDDCRALLVVVKRTFDQYQRISTAKRAAINEEMERCTKRTTRRRARRIARRIYDQLDLANIALHPRVRERIEQQTLEKCRCDRACAGR
ncbi:MAG: hypothetical protein QF464_23640, partial [Myxococcota bacterium]|nr:hypothetical protein [Myxococcota bacterium]